MTTKALVVPLLLQVHGHTTQEGLDVLTVDRVGAYGVLETVQYRVQTDAFLDRAQVTRSLFIEALVVGIGGSILGCLGGVGLATAILGFLNASGF